MRIHRRTAINHSGLTLIEIMIATGIASILVLGTTAVVTQTLRATRGVTLSNDFENLKAHARQFLMKQQNCTSAIPAGTTFVSPAPGDPPIEIALTEILYPDASVLIRASEEYTSGLRVDGIKLTGFTQTFDPDEWSAQIRVDVSKLASGGQTPMGAPTLSVDLPIMLTTQDIGGGSRAIISCAGDTGGGGGGGPIDADTLGGMTSADIIDAATPKKGVLTYSRSCNRQFFYNRYYGDYACTGAPNPNRVAGNAASCNNSRNQLLAGTIPAVVQCAPPACNAGDTNVVSSQCAVKDTSYMPGNTGGAAVFDQILVLEYTIQCERICSSIVTFP